MSTSCWLRDGEGLIPCFEVLGGGEHRLAVGKDCKPEGRVEDVVPDLDDHLDDGFTDSALGPLRKPLRLHWSIDRHGCRAIGGGVVVH